MISLNPIAAIRMLIGNVFTERLILPRSGTSLYTERPPSMHDVPPSRSFHAKQSNLNEHPTQVARPNGRIRKVRKAVVPNPRDAQTHKADDSMNMLPVYNSTRKTDPRDTALALYNDPNKLWYQPDATQESAPTIKDGTVDQQNTLSNQSIHLQEDMLSLQCCSGHENILAPQNMTIHEYDAPEAQKTDVPVQLLGHVLDSSNGNYFINQSNELHNPACQSNGHAPETIDAEQHTAIYDTTNQSKMDGFGKFTHEVKDATEDVSSTNSRNSTSLFNETINVLGYDVNMVLLAVSVTTIFALSLYLMTVYRKTAIRSTELRLKSKHFGSYQVFRYVSSKIASVFSPFINMIRNVYLMIYMKVSSLFTSKNIEIVYRKGLRRGTKYDYEFQVGNS
ncbi:uncharacterized protein VICG_00459 [Vittaforma corneae ATCC 50505]|uniref:Uncharacterized protein n=1 Tax=Vittaforma corneae (strain ATCC 50505) TaxID=993615 RepID=L2GNE6_VITCO|nr:uncharacterized protein VICG_00459 [Vittaforma corneae ATCC 50505]ELA42361.1 hypothetical protein VICG_00459 [Vittaforma corneae ATCC 50505]